MGFLPADFESAASACSAIRACSDEKLLEKKSWEGKNFVPGRSGRSVPE